MAEPKGIILEASISQKALKKLINHKLVLPAHLESGQHVQSVTKRVVDFFSKALYYCDNNTNGLFLLNYEETKEQFFCAFILKHYDSVLIGQFQEVLALLALYKDKEACDYAIVTSLVPEVDFGYKIETNNLSKVDRGQIPNDKANSLVNKFWSFSTDDNFPELDVAFRKRSFFYKPFRVAYKKFVQQQEEIERPNNIANATKEKPFHLFDDFYTYNNSVFHSFKLHGEHHEIPLADPYTFKKLASVFVDKNHVYSNQLLHNGSPATLQNVNHPDTKWEYFIIPGIDAQTLDYVRPKDTLYLKDKYYVYFKTMEQGACLYKKVASADVNSFDYLDFCFGKDKKHVFFKGDIIDIDPKDFNLNENGFIFDRKNIYHYENKIALDPTTFKVVSFESITNPFIGNFILEDKNGTYEYEQSRGLKLLKS